jgi:hypothetical protein
MTSAFGSAEACSRAARFGGFADDRLFLRRALADQVADDHQPGGDADPRLELDGFDIEATDSVDRAQPRPDRPLGIVLMRSRVTEIDQNAVAHVFRDKAIELGNDPGDGAVIGGDDLAQILGIELRRQRRRANQIAKHHRQLSALGSWHSRSLHHSGIGFAVQCGYRPKQLVTVAPKHHAEVLEILRRELGQGLPIDLVVAESRFVTLETQAAQPRRCVHQTPPNSSSSALASFRSGVPKLSVNQP